MHFLLAAMIGLAFLLHIGALSLFHLVYPGPKSLPPEPVRVLAPGPQTPGWENAKVWIEAADPSIFAPMRAEESPGLLRSPRPYIPSFMRSSLEFRLPGELSLELPPPRLARPPPVLETGQDAAVPPQPPPRLIIEKSARFSINGEPVRTIAPDGEFMKQLAVPPTAPALFLVLIGDDAQVRNLFLQSTSGSSQWDAWAGNALRREKFKAPPNSSGWAWVSVELEKSLLPPVPVSGSP